MSKRSLSGETQPDYDRQEGPCCDVCTNFLLDPCSCCAMSLCRYCALMHNCGKVPTPFSASLRNWLKANFATQWTTSEGDELKEYTSRLPDYFKVDVFKLEPRHALVIIKTALPQCTVDPEGVFDSPVPQRLSQVYETVRFTTESPPEVDMTTCLGYLAMTNLQNRWSCVILVSKRPVSV